MNIDLWFLLVGATLIVLVLSDQWLKHGPISAAIVYLAIGYLLGPKIFDALDYDILKYPHTMELGAEIVVMISLFSAGLKLQLPFRHPHWKLSAILASLAMVLTVILLSITGHFIFGLPWAAAILLGGILAPTDPVLASDVQVKDEKDKNRIRRALTGEAGFNDGTAFPIVMLGLTLLGARWANADQPLLQWGLIDFAWAISGGLLIGYFCGWLAAKMIVLIHARKSQRMVIEDFATIGLISVTFGLAQLCSTYGFLAVFAAAVAFVRAENRHYNSRTPQDSAGFSPHLIRFTAQLDRFGEIITVLFLGLVAGRLNYSLELFLLPVLLILVIRPIAVFASLGRLLPTKEKGIVSWFGIRGVGSIYYLSYALNHGLEGESASVLFNLVMLTIVISIFVHGITASPIMRSFERN